MAKLRSSSDSLQYLNLFLRMKRITYTIPSELSSLKVNLHGQLCLPDANDPKKATIFNKIGEGKEGIFLGYSSKYLHPKKGW